MDVFGEDLEKLREAGIGLGLNDRQIDQCMIDALKAAKKSLAPRPNDASTATAKTKTSLEAKTAGTKETPPKARVAKATRARRGKCSLLCRYTGRVLISLVVLFVCFYVLVEHHPPAARYALRFLEPWSYSIARWWRILTLPLARRVDLTAMYDGSCAIDNPFLSMPRITCDKSMKVQDVQYLDSVTRKDFEKKYQNSVKLLVLKGNSKRLVPYTTLRSWYRDNELSLRISKNVIRTSSEISLDELLGNYTGKDIRDRPDFHFEMSSAAVNPSRLLRQLFPRPDFLPIDTEVAMEKVLIVDSPTARPYPLALYTSHNHWYVQGGGTRQLYFHPNFDCLPKGTVLSATVHAGDMVYFHGPYWHVDSGPDLDDPGSDVSVAFVGSFV